MTYDEWQKARVEAAIEGIRSAEEQDFPNYKTLGEAALKAADAVPLPDLKSVHSFVASLITNALGKDPDDPQCSYVASGIITGLVPWIAAQIENGK